MRTTYVDNCVVHSHTLYFHTYMIRHAQFTHTHTHSLLTHINSHSVVTHIHTSLITHSYIYTHFLYSHTYMIIHSLLIHIHTTYIHKLSLFTNTYIYTLFTHTYTRPLFTHIHTLSYTRFLLHSKAHISLHLSLPHTHFSLTYKLICARTHTSQRERERCRRPSSWQCFTVSVSQTPQFFTPLLLICCNCGVVQLSLTT